MRKVENRKTKIQRRSEMETVKDAFQIMKIVAIVVSSLNLNSIQENKLNNYVRMKQYEWIEQRKSEREIEEIIKSHAETITFE